MKRHLKNILKIIVFFFSWAILIGIIPDPVAIEENSILWRFFAELIPLLVLVILTYIFYKLEKKKLDLRFLNLKDIPIGIFIGIFWLAIPFIFLILTGNLEFISKNQVPKFWIWSIAAFINVIMQELLIRGYIYELLKREYSLKISIIVTTLIFTLLHGGAISSGFIPVLNVVTMSIFISLLFEYKNFLTAPIIAHGIWNIVDGLVLGVVSLAEDYPSIYNVKFNTNINQIEESLVVFLINILFIGILIKLISDKRKEVYGKKEI